MNLKSKLALFGKIQLITFIIGIAFIFRDVSQLDATGQRVGWEKAIHLTSRTLLGGPGAGAKKWLLLLPFYGTCLFMIRTDLLSKTFWSVFKKWSVLFFALQFTTDLTMYGWTKASADFPVMMLSYICGGFLAASVWWLIECSPRNSDQAVSQPAKSRRMKKSKSTESENAN